MPDEPIPTLGEKEYEVIGPHAVHGVPNGEVVKLDLTEDQERFYLEGGHLKVAGKSNQKKKEE